MARQYYGYNPVNENKQNNNSVNNQSNQDKLKDPPPKYRGYNPVGQNQNNFNNINQNYNQQSSNFVQPQVDTSQQNNQNYYNSNINGYNQQNNNLGYNRPIDYQMPIYSGPFPHKIRKADLSNRVSLALSHGAEDYAEQKGLSIAAFISIALIVIFCLFFGIVNIRAIQLDMWQKLSLGFSAIIFIVSILISTQRHNIAKRNVNVGNYSLYEDRLVKVSESMAIDFGNKTSTTYYILYLEGLGMSYKTVSPAFEEGDLVIVQTVNVYGKKEIIQVVRK